MHRIVLVAALAATVACAHASRDAAPAAAPAAAPTTAPAPSGDPPAPSVSDAELERKVREVMGMLAELADVVRAAGTDCARMAAGVDAAVESHRELLAEVRALDGDPTVGDRVETWLDSHRDQTQPLLDELVSGVAACASDPAVAAAFEKLGAL